MDAPDAGRWILLMLSNGSVRSRLHVEMLRCLQNYPKATCFLHPSPAVTGTRLPRSSAFSKGTMDESRERPGSDRQESRRRLSKVQLCSARTTAIAAAAGWCNIDYCRAPAAAREMILGACCYGYVTRMLDELRYSNSQLCLRPADRSRCLSSDSAERQSKQRSSDRCGRVYAYEHWRGGHGHGATEVLIRARLIALCHIIPALTRSSNWSRSK